MPTLLLIGGDQRFSDDVATLVKLDGYTVVAAVGSGRAGIDYAFHYQPDVMVLLSTVDVDEGDGLATIEGLLHTAPQSKLIVWSARDDAVYIEHALALGVSAYVRKGTSYDTFREVLAAVVRGTFGGFVESR